eukprot:Skav233275  [mRNA]  locus=scaffold3673:30720:31965:- [translate_table: standard]
MADQAVVPSERDSSDECVGTRVKGRQRKAWEVIAVQAFDPGEIRGAGQKWLSKEAIVHQTLTASSDKGVKTLIARCGSCLKCSKQWCFSVREEQLRVETCGYCFGDKAVITRPLVRLTLKALVSFLPKRMNPEIRDWKGERVRFSAQVTVSCIEKVQARKEAK